MSLALHLQPSHVPITLCNATLTHLTHDRPLHRTHTPTDLVQGAYLADAATLLDMGHTTWGVPGEGDRGWTEGQRFYGPSLEGMHVLEPGLGLMLSPYLAMTVRNLAPHPLTLSFSLWMPGTLANQHHFRSMASRQVIP